MLVLVELAEVTQRLLAQSCRRYLAIPCVIKKELRLGLSTLAIRNAAAGRSAHLLLLRKGSLPLRASAAHFLHHGLLLLAHAACTVRILVILVLHVHFGVIL